jgi:DNA-binding NarL/FixJ family response regulator
LCWSPPGFPPAEELDTMIRILVVDDHELVRTAVCSLLEEAGGFLVVGSCADGQEAVYAAHLLKPDVVLMDLSMPRMGGVEATRRLIAAHPGLRIVIFTSAVDGRQVREAMAAGAVGHVFKTARAAELVRALCDAGTGESACADIP